MCVHAHMCVQGVVTGVVEGCPQPGEAPSTNIMNSQLYKMAVGELVGWLDWAVGWLAGRLRLVG